MGKIILEMEYFIKSMINQMLKFRATQREYSSKPLKYGIVQRILLFKR